MSRLIVKNLPDKVNADRLKEKFSEKGEVTDVQLLFTSQGKFRKFAFVGYKTAEQASEAIKHYDGTYFNSSKMKVELCADLGSAERPRPWSKHSKKADREIIPLPLKTKKDKKKQGLPASEELVEKVKRLKDDPEFHEFLEIHSCDKVLEVLEGEDHDDENTVDNSRLSETDDIPEAVSKQTPAHANISDQDYLKLKMKGNVAVLENTCEKPPSNKQCQLFTVKVKNLPKGIKKQQIRELFKPCMAASVRKAKGLLGIVYVGFKTEKEMRKALIKNRSFLKGKKLAVSECKEKQTEIAVPDKWKSQDRLQQEESVAESGRIFIRNLCYSAKEEEIEALFSKYGPLTEIVLPLDKLTRKSKGYGTVTFVFPEHAVTAYTDLDGTVFQGRMLHLLPAQPKQESLLESNNFKKLKKAKLKKTSGYSYNWNTLFLGTNAVADVVAETYKASKQDVLTGGEAAVRLALGETQLVASTRKFLEEQGICLDAFNRDVDRRSKTVILVKNLPASTSCDEIREKFDTFGIVDRVVLPPGGIMAVVEFEEPSEARTAFTKLAYTKFKNLPLYLEWAPENIFNTVPQSSDNLESSANDRKEDDISEKEEDPVDDIEPEPDTTLYVKNLSFETSEDNLRNHFSKCGRLAGVTVSRKRDPKNPKAILSLGYGFVQFYLRSEVNKALAELQGSLLDGHTLEIKRSDRTSRILAVSNKKSVNVTKQTGAKILVRNVPFQADVSEMKHLFSTFGHLKSVRMPKKMAGTGKHRGFCFVEFSTKHEAKVAMKALCQSTHLYGRRLVLEWAAPESSEIDAIRKRTAQHFPIGEGAESKRSNKAVADISMDSQGEDSDNDD